MTQNPSHNPTPNLLSTLSHIAKTHRKRLAGTFSLVILENLLLLLYPLVGSFAVNAVMAGKLWHALSYALVVFVIWGVGSARRAVDTRAFVRIYAELAVPLIISQRKTSNVSTTTARVALSRQFVDFFEDHLPSLLTTLFSIIGSVVMLMVIEFWSGVVALVILILFGLALPKYTKTNDKLYFKLNNRLEKEVDLIEMVNPKHLNQHYDLVSRLRIAISNREAFSYLIIGIAMMILFGFTLSLFTLYGYQSAGHIYAVMTYLWTFAFSLDTMPSLIEQFSELKDIGKRVNMGDDDDATLHS